MIINVNQQVYLKKFNQKLILIVKLNLTVPRAPVLRRTEAKVLSNSDTINTIVAGITLGTELADPWNARHKYVGFGLGD